MDIEEKIALNTEGKTIKSARISRDEYGDICHIDFVFTDGAKLEIGAITVGSWGEESGAIIMDFTEST